LRGLFYSEFEVPQVEPNVYFFEVEEGEPVGFTGSIEDFDLNDWLTFSVVNAPTGVEVREKVFQNNEFNQLGFSIDWFTGAGDAGTYDILFQAIDNGNPVLRSEVVTLRLVVGESNIAPSFAVDTQSRFTVEEAQNLNYQFVATDANTSDVLSFTASNLPAGADLDISTGQFDWTPELGQAGEYLITVTVTDNGNPELSDSQEVTIFVEAAAPNLPPEVNDIITALDAAFANGGITNERVYNRLRDLAVRMGEAINEGRTNRAERLHDRMEDIIDAQEDRNRVNEDTAELLFDLLDIVEDTYDL